MARIAGSTPRSTSTIHQRPARTASAFGRTAKNVHSLRARRRSSIAMARCYHWWHNGPAGRPPMNVNRRFALRTLAQFAIAMPQARPVYRPGTGNAMAPPTVRPADVVDRWLALDMFDDKPMEPPLSGLELEYRIVTLYSRDRGAREAQLGATLGTGTDDIG